MALHLGELSIALELDNDRVRTGMAGAKRELESLPPKARQEMLAVSRELERGGQQAGQKFGAGLVRDAAGRLRNARGQFASEAEIALAGLDPVAERKGKETGGKLAQGINQSLIRNSPLIAAVVGGALAAGAPVATAGAVALFGGIGAVAAAQSVEVRSAWAGLGREIRDGAVADAAVLIPELTGMADDLGSSFERVRPQLRAAFDATGPLLDDVTDGVTGLAENAMPGLVRAVQSADPVMAGFQSFLEDTGSGLGGFFGAVAEHGPAAGQVFTSLGQILAALLPTLGELLGTGAELASVVLPPVADAVEDVAQAAQALGPALPAIVAGFTAMKVAGSVGGLLASGAEAMGRFADRSRVGSTAATRVGVAMSDMSDGIGRASAALPALGIVIAGVGADMSDATRQEEEWAAAILAGGDAAVRAYEEYKGGTHWGQSVDEATGLAASWGEATSRAEEMRGSMTPLEQAQLRVQQAQAAVTEATAKHGDAHPKVVGAVNEYKAAQAALAEQEARTELAIYGVTSAMAAQALQALAAADSDLGYRLSVNSTEDALRDLQLATREHGHTSEEAQDAALAYEQALLAQANAAGVAEADALGLTDELDRNRVVTATALAELYRMRDEMGDRFPAALQATISRLEATGVALTDTETRARTAREAAEGLGLAVYQLPNDKRIYIDTPTAEQVQKLADLGYRVKTLPNGQVIVYADTYAAQRAIDTLVNQRRTIMINTALANGTSTSVAMGRPTAATGGALEGGFFRNYQTGGAVHGPGGPTDDLVPAAGPEPGVRYRLSNGEHVLTAAEVRAAGGHGAIFELRRDLLAGAARGYATGGMVRAEDGSYVPASFYDRTAGPSQATLLASAQRRMAAGQALTPEQQAAVNAAMNAARPAAAPAAATTGRSITITVHANTADERRIADAIAARLRTDEFVGGFR